MGDGHLQGKGKIMRDYGLDILDDQGARQAPRAGWFLSYDSQMDVEPLSDLPLDDGDKEWTW